VRQNCHAKEEEEEIEDGKEREGCEMKERRV